MHHVSLSSYAVELWGIIEVIACAGRPCNTYTDSKTIVDLFATLHRVHLKHDVATFDTFHKVGEKDHPGAFPG